MGITKKILGIGFVGVMSLGFGTGVLASDTSTTTTPIRLEVEGAGIHVNVPGISNFGDITISSDVGTYSTNLEGNKTVEVKDLRGTLEGWDLTVGATQFSDGNGKVLPLGSLTLDGVDGKDREDVTTQLGVETVIDGSTVPVAKADANNGGGVTNIEFGEDAVKLKVDPKTAVAGNFVTTVTWSLENTPTP